MANAIELLAVQESSAIFMLMLSPPPDYLVRFHLSEPSTSSFSMGKVMAFFRFCFSFCAPQPPQPIQQGFSIAAFVHLIRPVVQRSEEIFLFGSSHAWNPPPPISLPCLTLFWETISSLNELARSSAAGTVNQLFPNAWRNSEFPI